MRSLKTIEKVQTVVLGTKRWKQRWHMPVCCQRQQCPLARKRNWHNYVAHSRTEHLWAWPANQKLHAFFLWSDWRVTTAWLRQISKRLVSHFASFEGEAPVHKAEAALFGGEDISHTQNWKRIFRAWIVWRVALGIEERRHALRETCE